MDKNINIREIDKIVRPIGFIRNKLTWNRRNGNLVQVINFQISNNKDMFTLNFGIFDDEIYKIVWNKPPPSFIEEPICVVRSRIGSLIDGLDLWWKLSDANVPARLKFSLTEYGLPFFGRLQNRELIEASLEADEVWRLKYPLPNLNLIAIKALNGDQKRARELLEPVCKNASGAWRTRYEEVKNRLGL